MSQITFKLKTTIQIVLIGLGYLILSGALSIFLNLAFGTSLKGSSQLQGAIVYILTDCLIILYIWIKRRPSEEGPLSLSLKPLQIKGFKAKRQFIVTILVVPILVVLFSFASCLIVYELLGLHIDLSALTDHKIELLQLFIRKNMPFVGIIITTLLFAMSHSSLNGGILALCFGLVLGCVYYYTKSLIITILMHGVANTMSDITINTVAVGIRQVNHSGFYWIVLVALLVITGLGTLKSLKILKRGRL